MEMKADPAAILDTGFSFWKSKVLLTAVELELFTVLGEGAQTGEQLGAALGLHPRGIWDFFDALVALGFLEREGTGPAGLYRSTPATGQFLDKRRPGYLGGILEMLRRGHRPAVQPGGAAPCPPAMHQLRHRRDLPPAGAVETQRGGRVPPRC